MFHYLLEPREVDIPGKRPRDQPSLGESPGIADSSISQADGQGRDAHQ